MLFGMKLGVTLTALAFACVSLAQTPAVKPERIRGEIVSLDGDTLKVHRPSGETVSIEVKPAVTVSAVKGSRRSTFPRSSPVRLWALRRRRVPTAS